MKLLLRLLLLMVMSSAYAQSNLPACQGSDISRWTDCFGTISQNLGEKYEGEFKNGTRQGQGTFTLVDGSKYVGEFRGGWATGLGTYTYLDGRKYVGEFQLLQFHGPGTIYAANGSIIRQGIWANDRFVHSEPIKQLSVPNKPFNTLSTQTTYPACQGRDISRWTNCFGTRTWDNGQMYIGEFKDGNYHGQGAFYAANGAIIHQGIWTNGSFRSELVQQSNTPSAEVTKLWEAEEAKRKNAEQEQLRLSQNQSPSLPVTASFMGKRLALVIGNQAYNVRPLLNPRNDADDMSRALKNAGFEVIDVRDASLAQMRNAVRQFGDRLLTRDVGLVYYSGHGIEVRGRNYFIPVNADIKRSDEIADQSLDVNLILEKMETAKKGVNILIVDACRDDPFGRSFRSSSRGLANMDAPQGTIIAFATSPGKVAADGEGRNSPYTKNLIKTMQIPNLPIEQVFKQVRRAVQQETKNQQTPWENTSLSGDFYFSVKK